MGIGLLLAAGMSARLAPAASETDVLPRGEAPMATNACVCKRGTITVATYRKTEFNRCIIRTDHYQIYSELDPAEFPPQELGMLMEAMFEQYCRFFAVTPDLKGDRWPVEMYASPQRFQQLLFGGANGVFYAHTRKAHSHRIDGPLDWTDKLMVHECTHQFHALSGVKDGHPVSYGSATFGFVNEGIATFGEGTLWDPKTETVKIGYPLPGRSAHGRNISSNTPRTFDDMIMHYIDRDVDFNTIMFLVHRRTRQAEQLLRDNRAPAVAWKAAFGTLDMDADFWKDYEAFVDVVSDYANEGKGLFKDLYFTSWDDMIRRNELVDRVVTLRRAARLLGDKAPSGLTALLARLEPMSANRTDAARSEGLALYDRELPARVGEILATGHPAADPAAALLLGCSLALSMTAASNGTFAVEARVNNAYQSASAATVSYSIVSRYDGRTLAASMPATVMLPAGKPGVSTWTRTWPAPEPAVLKAEVKLTLRGRPVALRDEIVILPSIGTWWVLAPFDNAGDATVDTRLPPETEPVDLSKTYTGMAQPRRMGVKDVDIAWTRADRPRDLPLDQEFRVRIPYSERAAAYAVTWIESAREQKAILGLGADDGIMAWLNDVEVSRHLVNSQGYRSMEYREPVTLKKGVNKLLLKITQSGWGWEFGAHLLDPNGDRELSGVRWVAAPASAQPERRPAH